MKKSFSIFFLIITSVITFAQRGNPEEHDLDIFNKSSKIYKDCDARVLRTDSSVNLAYNNLTGEHLPVQVTIYSYDSRENVTQVIVKKLPERVNVYKQVFEYDNSDNQVRYTYYPWVNNEWFKSLIVDKTYSIDGKLLTEVYQNLNSAGEFRPYMQHFYSYNGDIISGYLRQLLNAQGEWYDFSRHYYIYDGFGRLTVLYGQYNNNGPIYWERTTYYDSENRISERYFRQLKYNASLKKNVLTNVSYEQYNYNVYYKAEEVLLYDWNGETWIYKGKVLGYFSFIPDKKVSICHNGQTICVSPNAVLAHLEHGDKLGSCIDEETDRKKSAPDDQNVSSNFDIYPNPAKNHITIKFKEPDINYIYGVLLSSEGKNIAHFMPENKTQIDYNVSNLKSGTYFIKMFRDSGMEETEILIIK